jgi:hypothetical protein
MSGFRKLVPTARCTKRRLNLATNHLHRSRRHLGRLCPLLRLNQDILHLLCAGGATLAGDGGCASTIVSRDSRCCCRRCSPPPGTATAPAWEARTPLRTSVATAWEAQTPPRRPRVRAWVPPPGVDLGAGGASRAGGGTMATPAPSIFQEY